MLLFTYPESNLQHPNVTFYEQPKMATFTELTRTVDMPDVGMSLSITKLRRGEEVSLLVHPCLAGQFVLPPGYAAVSPVVFLIVQESTDEDLPETLAVSIQHFACLKSKEDCDNMTFLLAATRDAEGSELHAFTNVAGEFNSCSNIGKVVLEEFGFLVVAQRKIGKIHHVFYYRLYTIRTILGGNCFYSLRLLPTAVEESHVEAVLYSCLNHPVYEKVIQSN